MNLCNMLPFLEGWEQLAFGKQETVEKGRYIDVFSRNVKGWLTSLDFLSDDAYASVKLTHLGFTGIITPHSYFILGLVVPPPFGSFVVLCIRPSTLSTAGMYAISPFTMAYPMPIKGLVRLELGLEIDSTQVTATAGVTFTAIEIIDEKAFIRSVRKFKYGWLGWAFDVLSRIPGLKYVGIPKEIKEVME